MWIISDFRKQGSTRKHRRNEFKEKGKEGTLNKGTETETVQPFWESTDGEASWLGLG